MTAARSYNSPPLPPHAGILLIGHGTRDAAGHQEFLVTAQRLQEAVPGNPVEPCFLELSQPTISEGWHRLAARGVTQIVATPLLLFSAGHAKRDIPDVIHSAAKTTP